MNSDCRLDIKNEQLQTNSGLLYYTKILLMYHLTNSPA